MSGPDRLRSSREIREVFAAGRSGGSSSVVVHARPGTEQTTRVAVVAGRRCGNAVSRNRAKRRLRAALGEIELPEGQDLVVVAKSPAVDTSFPRLLEDLNRALGRMR